VQLERNSQDRIIVIDRAISCASFLRGKIRESVREEVMQDIKGRAAGTTIINFNFDVSVNLHISGVGHFTNPESSTHTTKNNRQHELQQSRLRWR
jgi:hypothetical protein